MKKFLFLSTALLLLNSCNTVNPVNEPNQGDDPYVTNRDPLFEPTNGKKILIMGQDLGAVGGMQNYTDGYMDDASLPTPSGFTTYTSLTVSGSNRGLSTTINDGAGDKCADKMVNHPHQSFSNKSPIIAIGLYMVNGEKAVADGNLDAYIEQLGTWVKNSGCPIFLRIGYEFDGTWNHYEPENYKLAFQHIVRSFEKQGVKNCAYVWQSDGFKDGPINEKWYPGDEYVDWFGYSHFTARGEWMLDFARQRKKPVLIAEATPNYHDIVQNNTVDEWNAWFKPLFDYINANSDVIKGLAYINAQWYSQNMWKNNEYFNKCDSRVQRADETFKAKWRSEFNTNNWFNGSEALDHIRGW